MTRCSSTPASKLGIEPGETTKGGELTVEFAECLGVCDYAPAALADDGRVFGPLEEKSVDAMLEELKRGRSDGGRGIMTSPGPVERHTGETMRRRIGRGHL